MGSLVRHLSLTVYLFLLLQSCTPDVEMAPGPVRLGVIRTVDPARLEDPEQWGPALDLALEAEFWDLIGNSAHARYGAWHHKATDYVDANRDADPRLAMMISAGAVFELSTLFESPDPLSGLADYADYLYDATVGIDAAALALRDHEPAMVFFHNNQAMLAFLLTSDADLGVCHLEKLRNLEDVPGFGGTEGRAAAPFTYGMVHDEAYVDYAIAMMEGCDTAVCNWTSELAPFKPIGQLMTLAELHSIRSTWLDDPADQAAAHAEVEHLLDRAEMLGAMRHFPFMDRIDALRVELPTRVYTEGMGLGRSPMPVYSNETNCSLCHIGGLPGAHGEDLPSPYPGAAEWTQRPGPPAFQSSDPVSCDLTAR